MGQEVIINILNSILVLLQLIISLSINLNGKQRLSLIHNDQLQRIQS